MPFDGNGTFDPPSPAYPAVSDTEIFAADRNEIDQDFANGLSNCVTRDGQSPALADISFGGFKATAMAEGTNPTDGITLSQIQNRAWTGTQNFTGAVITVPTQISGDSSAKAASTAFVAAVAFNTALPTQSGATDRKVPVSDGTNAAWESVELTDMVSGILPQANGGTGTASATGTGAAVYATGATLTDPVFVSPSLGTPDSGVVTNLTGTAAGMVAGKATVLETPRNIDGQSFDGSASITVIAPGTNAATSKATPVDADEIPLVDSAASNVLKKLTWVNLKATLTAVFAAVGAVTSSGLTMSTARVLGRTTASSGAVEELTVGDGLSLSAGALAVANAGITGAKLSGAQTGSAPVFGIRAWARITVSGGVPTVASSGNVSASARSSLGQYTVTFTTALPAGYGMVATAKSSGSIYTLHAQPNPAVANTTTVAQIMIQSAWADGAASAQLHDPEEFTVWFIG